jgi:xanthine dehydrogenase accessory factor
MAFTDAIFDGRARLAGLEARRVDELEELVELLQGRSALPVVVMALPDVILGVSPDVVVDARMRKRALPEIQRGLVLLTIGLGPNFVAGETTDVVVETSWGDDLGKVITQGATRPLTGEPRPYGGHSRDRFVNAPLSGRFHSHFRIGDPVTKGQVVAYIENLPLAVTVSGILRGLVRDGVPVELGAKVVEVDPRQDPSQVFGIGERPGLIGDAVVSAVASWLESSQTVGKTPAP